MIEVTGVNKMFGEIKALDNIVATIQEGSIFGLIGTNGAGKSTLLRVISGVLKPDTGMALIDGENVYENPQGKQVLSGSGTNPDNDTFRMQRQKRWQNIIR